MIFPNHWAVFAFNTFDCHTRPHHLRKTKDIDGIQIRARLDFVPHRRRPRFGTKNTHFQRTGFGIDAETGHRIEQGQHVRGRDEDQIRF